MPAWVPGIDHNFCRYQANAGPYDNLFHKRGRRNTRGERNWPMQEWFKIKQASKYCGLSERTLRRLLKEGLPYSRVGGTILLKREWIDEYFKSFKVEHNKIDEIVDEVLRDF